MLLLYDYKRKPGPKGPYKDDIKKILNLRLNDLSSGCEQIM
ncbi:Uncharacterized protein EbC_pEb17201120 (plasmid) [Erwinia billingiae Eb661]|uniref:Uncharacterized protein n=1 Tax=Erwinia billingiae (strain Eb661) TaxID=634500 RepID=D8MJW7_ERWBE|nr:Uncharacterized protein EbC_pEb17201120 [Erwinia billingiae Eb661]